MKFSRFYPFSIVINARSLVTCLNACPLWPWFSFLACLLKCKTKSIQMFAPIETALSVPSSGQTHHLSGPVDKNACDR